MNYFDAMKKLKLFNENRKALYQTLNIPYNITKKAQDRMSACEEITPHNLKRMTCIFAESGEGVWAPGLKESVRQSCRSLQIPYSPALQNATAAYENTLSRIHAEAAKEMKKADSGSVLQSPARSVGALFCGMLTAVFLILSVVLNTMELPYLDTSGFVFLPVIGVGFLILTLLLCFYKSKPDQNKLQELAAELKRTSLGYFGFLHTTFKGAYDQLDARFNEQLEQLKANAVEEIGETIVELYETVPLRQQPYFLELGVTATCENDFYAIAQECIKAEKTDQQIDLQNYIRQQAREDIDRGVREMKRSMRQIEQEISAGNARIAEQNERNLQNQNKALNELKKQSKQNAELKEKLRDIERNMDN